MKTTRITRIDIETTRLVVIRTRGTSRRCYACGAASIDNKDRKGKIMRTLFFTLIAIAVAIPCAAQDFNRYEIYAGWSQAQTKSNVEALDFSVGGAPAGGYSDLCSTATGEMLGTNSQKVFCDRRGFSGFELGGTWNFNRWLGVSGSIARHTKDDRFVDDFGGIIQTITTEERLTTFTAGVQLKDNSLSGSRFRPFAHALVGSARYTNEQAQTIDAFPQFNFVAEDRETSFTMKIGAGLDVRVAPHVDLRVIQVDYSPVYAGDRDYPSSSGPFTFHVKGKTSQNYTVGFGVVIH